MLCWAGHSFAEAGQPPRTGAIEAPDGVLLHYSDYGKGSKALVFVHGFSCDRSYWREQVGPFSRRFRVVTLDLAGHGDSGASREAWTIEAYGADVSAVVEGLDLRNVVLIGHSMGGAVILDAARRLPGRLEGLIFVDTYENFDGAVTAEAIAEQLSPFHENFVETTRGWVRSMFRDDADPGFVEHIVDDMSGADPDVALPTLESAITAMVGTDLTSALSSLDVPVFAINADYGPTDVDSFLRHGVELEIIERSGHFFMMEQPETFNRALMKAVEAIVR